MDAPFYFVEFSQALAAVLAAEQGQPLDRLVRLSDEVRDPRSDDGQTFRYIEIGSVEPRLDRYTVVALPVTDAPSRARMVVRKGDILLSTTRPDRGAMARIREEDDGAIASTGFAVLRSPSIDLDLLFEALQTTVVTLQLRQRSSGGAYPAITADQLRRVVVPYVSPPRSQRLLAWLDAARAELDRRLASAEDTLAGLDAFVLRTLGLTLPPSPEPGTPFTVTLGALRAGGKISPDYSNPERTRAVRVLEAAGADRLANIAEFVREQRMFREGDFYVGLANVAPNTGEFVAAEYAVEGAVVAFAPGDVLFSKLRPYLNKVWLADRAGVASPEFHVLRLKPAGPMAVPEFLAAALRAPPTLAQTKHMTTGNTHPRLAPEDVEALVVPVPRESIQRAIAAEVERRRAEARRLRAEAREGWERARAEFEAALLGPPPS